MKAFISASLLMVLSLSSCDNNPLRPIEYGQGEDYEVYRALLTSDFGTSSSLIVLYDSTGASLMFLDSASIANVKSGMPGLLDETITDFISTNATRSQMRYVPGVDHLVLSSDYNEGKGSGTVHVGLSRIGYDKSGTQAVVEIGTLWAPLAGSGALVLLVKENGGWIVKSSHMIWIS
jgi:hypothetical protein